MPHDVDSDRHPGKDCAVCCPKPQLRTIPSRVIPWISATDAGDQVHTVIVNRIATKNHFIQIQRGLHTIENFVDHEITRRWICVCSSEETRQHQAILRIEDAYVGSRTAELSRPPAWSR